MTKKEYRNITLTAETRIASLMELRKEKIKKGKGNQKDDHGVKLLKEWAYGAYLLWDVLTVGYQKEGDKERMEELTKDEQDNEKTLL